MGLCGIDEAGRGPIAGALVMAGVILHKEISGLNDSKNPILQPEIPCRTTPQDLIET